MDPIDILLGLGSAPSKDPAAMAKQLRGQRDLGNFLGLSTIAPVNRTGQNLRREAQIAAQRGGRMRADEVERLYDVEQDKLTRQRQAEQDAERQRQFGVNTALSRARMAQSQSQFDKRFGQSERQFSQREANDLEAARIRASAMRNLAKSLTSADRKVLSQGSESVQALDNVMTGFKDEYGGNPMGEIGGQVQNWLTNKYPGVAEAVDIKDTPQAGWWADYRKTLELLERHELFGSQLTGGEQASWDAVAINEGMEPDEIKRRLAAQRNLVTKKLAENAKSIAMDPRKADAVSAFTQVLGTEAPVLGTEAPAQESGVLSYNPVTGKLE